jgi:uncharacterized protein (TIGR02594 family)
MANIPEKYKWLEGEGAPKMIVEGLKLVGIHEVAGSQHNPIIMGWAKELNLQDTYKADEIPWCGLVHAYLCKLAGKIPVASPLWALNWGKFGQATPIAMLGDTLVFKRPGGGHVACYVGEDAEAYHVMGGNQGDAYGFTRIPKFRLYAIRRPIYSIAQPANVRRIFLTASGSLSTNEQ